MAESAVIPATQELLEGPAGTPMSYWQLVWWRLRRDTVTLTAAMVILCIVLSALLAPSLAPHKHFEASIRKRLAPIGTAGHLLGTDEQGRDMLSRLLFGGRLSLLAGVVPVCIALLAGSTLGIVAGFMGRWGPAWAIPSSRCPLCLRLPSPALPKASPPRCGAGSSWKPPGPAGLAQS